MVPTTRHANNHHGGEGVKPTVLDACCGSRMFWFDREDDRAVFLDSRRESHILADSSSANGFRALNVSPSVLGDFRSMAFPDETFPLVVFDPPHLTGNGESGWLAKKYGKLPPEWEFLLSKGFAECFRVLLPLGTLVFKWNAIDIPISKVLALTSERPLFGNRQGKNAKTHWVVFQKPAPTPTAKGGEA